MINTARIFQNLLNNAGYPTLACGGYVRDKLLDRPFKDIDLATSATPEQMKAVFEKSNIQTYDTGIKHGTITAVLENVGIEITTLRVDKKCYGREADVVFTTSFEEDAKRRDFTINGMYMDLNTDEVFDYVGGKEDLKESLIRFIGVPSDRIKEDYLRILRFYRFQAVLGFYGDLDSVIAVGEYAPFLSYISQERIREETFKTLIGEHSDNFFDNPDLVTQIFPELEPCYGFAQNSRFHIYDVYTHITVGVTWLNQFKDPILSLAHLFHDVAKPFCHSRDEDGIDHFYGHEIEGERIAANMCYRLKLSTPQTERIKFLVANHMALHQEMGEKGFRRFIARCNEFSPTTLEDMLKIYEADCRGMNLELKLPIMEETIKALRAVQEKVPTVKKTLSPLTGEQIMTNYRLSPGILVGDIKKYLESKVIDGELNADDLIGAYSMVNSFLIDVGLPAIARDRIIL
jgi:tRNA nucleotidyltransferase (CCA-adding enzyme)